MEIYRILICGLLIVIVFFTSVSCVEDAGDIQQNKANLGNGGMERKKTTSSQKQPSSSTTSQISPPPVTITPPPVATPVIADNIYNTMGSFSTELIDNGENRVKNISIAAEEINGYILQPEAVFSFNDIVGRRSSSKGYKNAKIIVNGKVDWGVGGGICQLSSTIYNAVSIAGLTTVEKHSHSHDVGYVSSGQDAAVSYESLDFKFKNSKDFPIKIDVNVKDNKVNASIVKI